MSNRQLQNFEQKIRELEWSNQKLENRIMSLELDFHKVTTALLEFSNKQLKTLSQI